MVAGETLGKDMFSIEQLKLENILGFIETTYILQM